MVYKMSPGTSWRDLQDFFGLSEYEARAYEFLVREGPSTARRISVACGIPRTKVYETLRRLIEYKMVVETPVNPKRFLALPPNEALRPLLRSHRMAIKRSRMIVSGLQKIYERAASLANMVGGEFWLFYGSDAVRTISDTLLQSKERVIILLSWRHFIQFYNVFGRFLDELNEKGVRIQICFSADSVIEQRICREIGLKYKIANISLAFPVIFLRVDDEYFLAYLLPSGDHGSSNNSGVAIIVKSHVISSLVDEVLQSVSAHPELSKKANQQIH